MAFAIALCACGASPPRRAAPPPAGETGCTIRDTKIQSLGEIHIAIDGVEFARLPVGHFVELEATFANGARRVRAAAEHVILTGELAQMPDVRPRRHALIDGWLVVDQGQVSEVLGSSLRLEVKLPAGVEPKTTTITQPCSALTFASAPAHEVDGTVVDLARGSTTELRATPGGPVVARIVVPSGDADDSVNTFELERRGHAVRVRVSVPNAVEGWVPASAILDREPSVYGGLIGDEIGETQVSYLRCRSAVPIHVRSRGEKVRVGAIVPGADVKIGLTKEDDAFSLDLGVTEGLVPFVTLEDSRECDILVK